LGNDPIWTMDEYNPDGTVRVVETDEYTSTQFHLSQDYDRAHGVRNPLEDGGDTIGNGRADLDSYSTFNEASEIANWNLRNDTTAYLNDQSQTLARMDGFAAAALAEYNRTHGTIRELTDKDTGKVIDPGEPRAPKSSGTSMGGVPLTIGQAFAYTPSQTEVAARSGLYAAVDGANPAGNPLAKAGAYNANDPSLNASKNIGKYVVAPAATIATGAAIWSAAGGSTATVYVGSGTPFHVALEAGGTTVHSLGRIGAQVFTSKGAEAFAATSWGSLTGIPIFSSAAATTTGYATTTCVGGVATGLARGWGWPWF